MAWKYNNKEISDVSQLPPKTFGFVYITTHKPTGKSYIGKKFLFHNQKKKLGKKETELLREERKAQGLRGAIPKTKQVTKESDWKTYYGSQSDIKKLISGGKKDEFERTILECVQNKKQLTYFEIKYQMSYGVLEKPDEFFNDNILGKFFTRDLI
jgi:hypothetical protein